VAETTDAPFEGEEVITATPEAMVRNNFNCRFEPCRPNKEMKKFLLIDDERNFVEHLGYLKEKGLPGTADDWEIVKSYDEFVSRIVLHGLPELISFDHDLADIRGDEEFTGVTCARWLVNFCIEKNSLLPKYLVHSSNGEGAKNIDSIFKTYEKYHEKG
jgi:hypothetical protein